MLIKNFNFLKSNNELIWIVLIEKFYKINLMHYPSELPNSSETIKAFLRLEQTIVDEISVKLFHI